MPPNERYAPSIFGLVQMALLWFSANLTANNLTLAMLGPLVYELSFVDSALCAVFGGLLGSCGAAYMGTWGPESGNRTLVSLDQRVSGLVKWQPDTVYVITRYFMGCYPAKICALLNIVILIGKIYFFPLMDVVASHVEYPMCYFKLMHGLVGIPWKDLWTDW